MILILVLLIMNKKCKEKCKGKHVTSNINEVLLSDSSIETNTTGKKR